MPRPCKTCPFLREGGVRLRDGRIREIADGMLDSAGATFACHETIRYEGDDDELVTKDARHCAGALIFAEKNGNATQLMRIMERVGGYDARKLMADRKAVASVFDTVEEMLAASRAFFEAHSKKRGVWR